MASGVYTRTQWHIDRLKERSSRGENHYLWKGGKERFKCIICGNMVSNPKAQKCKKCFSSTFVPWNRGTKLPPIKCLDCGKQLAGRKSKRCISCHKKHYIPWNKGKICPQMQKEHSHMYKGGVSVVYKTSYNSPKYRKWRTEVFIRDNFTCVKCGEKSGYVTAHHIKPFSKIRKDNNIKNIEDAKRCRELWDINNGITLCEKCHQKEDRYRARFFKKEKNENISIDSRVRH